MLKSSAPDYILLSTLGIILISGILILASVAAPFGQAKFGDSYYFLKHQLIYGFLPGIFLAILLYKTKISYLKKIAPFLFLFGLILMFAVFLPSIGLHQEGASRWIQFGSFSFQPSELLKLSFILYLAGWLAGRNQKQKNETLILFFTIMGVIALLLFLQSNMSTLGIIAFTGFLMYFAAKTPAWHAGLIIILGIIAFFVLIHLAPYRLERFSVFLNPGIDPMGKSYQFNQATIAIGSGGLSGVGLGMSSQKLGFLPQSIADSIFAVFSEETGFIGAFLLILMFLTFLVRNIQLIKMIKDKFSQLVIIGITCWIITQTFVNIGAMIGLLPLTGVPLPFIAYGGSALIIELGAMGILLNISKQKG